MNEQRNKKLVISLSIAILCIVLGYFVFIGLDKNKKINETNKISSQDINTPNEVKTVLESKVSFPVKVIKSTKDASLQMNDENKIFLLGGSEELKVTEEMYTDGTKGIKVTYLIKQDMKNVYITLRNSILRENFATTSATRANIGAILMAENDNTIYKTYLQVVKSGETQVDISILNK
jgi:hypothetical protein